MKTHLSAPVVVAALLVAAGCSPAAEESPTPSPDPTPVTTTATPEPSPEPSPEPTTASPEPSPSFTLDAEQQEAYDTAVEYFTLRNELIQDHEAPLQPLINIVTGEALRNTLDDFQGYRENNLLQVGDGRFLILEVGEVTERDGEPFIEVTACTDTEDAALIDSETEEPVVDGSRYPGSIDGVPALALGGAGSC